MTVTDLPPTLDTRQAAELFGIGADCLYDLVRRGEAPVEPLRLGRKLRWPTAKVLTVLGLERDGSPHPTAGPTSTDLPDALAELEDHRERTT